MRHRFVITDMHSHVLGIGRGRVLETRLKIALAGTEHSKLGAFAKQIG